MAKTTIKTTAIKSLLKRIEEVKKKGWTDSQVLMFIESELELISDPQARING